MSDNAKTDAIFHVGYALKVNAVRVLTCGNVTEYLFGFYGTSLHSAHSLAPPIHMKSKSSMG